METKQNPTQQSNTLPASGIRLLAEFRSAALDVFEMPAANGRPALSILRAVHRLEIGDKAYELTEVLPKDATANSWVAPAKKGQQVHVELSLEPAEILQTGRDGKQRPARGLWRVRVLKVTPAL